MKDDQFIKNLLEIKEWHSFECKRMAVQPAKLLETVVAFANTDGGIIALGLEDPKKAKSNERIIGISENPENLSEFLKLIDKEIDPLLKNLKEIELDVINRAGEKDKILLIQVFKSDSIHSLKKGETFVRKGSQNVKITASEITRLQYEKGSIKYEFESARLSDLTSVDELLFRKLKQDTNSLDEDDWQFLRDNGLAGFNQNKNKPFLNIAGALLLCKNPAVTLGSKCSIKISHLYGTSINYSGEPNFVRRPISIEGPLIQQISATIDYFRDVIKSSPPRLSGSTFRPSFLVPEWAFQEAITNAVIHRNYSIQNDIQVRFFDDRIEVESPGVYPGHITPGNIISERFSRNPLIQRTLNRFQSAPNLDIGEGVDRMFKIMREANLYDPLFSPTTIKPNSVLLTLFNLQKVEFWDIVSKYLTDNYKITNNEARKITGIDDTLRMSRLLKTWVDKGLLEKVGVADKRNIFYRKPGSEPSVSFSTADENENTIYK
ncbi:MAG: RNA-binding domain-containing protein [Patescibacteria group bacterium]